MSKSQRTRRLRRRQAASRPRRRTAAVTFTGSLLVTAGLAVTPTTAHADDSDVGLVAVIGTDGYNRALPGRGTALGDQLFLAIDDGEHGLELWATDGSKAGTRLVKDINPSQHAYYSVNPDLVTFGDHVFFGANDNRTGIQLWRSDGTAAGTVKVSDLPTRPAGEYQDYGPRFLTVVGETLFFTVDTEEAGRELWASDGTTAGTREVADLEPGEGGSAPSGLTAVGDTLYFTADTTGTGRELWRSDGTAAGTTLVSDALPGPQTSFPHHLTPVGDDAVLFSATSPESGTELWASDGTTAGTAQVADLHPGTGSSFPDRLTQVDDRVYFNADDGTTGRELWSSDGTTAGTRLVADVRPGPRDSEPYYFTPVGDDGDIVFSAEDDQHGRELWRSDGTAAGTRLVRDINPGRTPRRPRWSDPRGLLRVGDDLYFTALTAVGSELWRTDGTPAGTELYADVGWAPTAYDSGVGQLTAVGTTLYFRADDGVHETQLWSTGPDATRRIDNRVRPRITGRPVPGRVLTASPGRWSPSATTYRYQWYRDGQAIRGATGRTLRVRPAMAGRRITVAVIASNRGSTSAIAMSEPTAKVKRGKPIRNLRRPTIRGAARVGSRVSVDVGRWKQRGLRFSFRWLVGDDVARGTERTFRIGRAAIGKRIAVVVTARKPAHAAEKIQSRPTSTVRR